MNRRTDPVLATGLALPVVAVLMLVGVSLSATPDSADAPLTRDLDRNAVVCATPAGTATSVGVSLGADAATIRPTNLGTASVFLGTGATASGLVAGQWTSDPPTVAACTAPISASWFVGLGAGPRHASVVELVNPTPGQAVIDLTLYGPGGELGVPDLRGIVVPANSAVRIELADQTPMLGWLTLHSQVVRGQVSVQVTDTLTDLDGSVRGVNQLPGQDAPATNNLLLGLVGDDSNLVITNPGTVRASVAVRLLAGESVFTPTGSEPVQIKPGETSTLDLARLLGSEVADGALGVVVASDQPVVSSLRTTTTSALTLVGASSRVQSASAVLVPTGAKSVVLGGADGVGSVVVSSFDRSGEQIDRRRVALTEGMGAEVDVPDAAQRIEVLGTNVSFAASAVVTDRGVVGFTEPAYTSLVPSVRPSFGG
ncbi:MAG: DUF5719 family protein [Nocardioides sp.]